MKGLFKIILEEGEWQNDILTSPGGKNSAYEINKYNKYGWIHVTILKQKYTPKVS